MAQHHTNAQAESLAALHSQEQQLVADVLRLYREGGTYADIDAKIGELRTVRRKIQAAGPQVVALQ